MVYKYTDEDTLNQLAGDGSMKTVVVICHMYDNSLRKIYIII